MSGICALKSGTIDATHRASDVVAIALPDARRSSDKNRVPEGEGQTWALRNAESWAKASRRAGSPQLQEWVNSSDADAVAWDYFKTSQSFINRISIPRFLNN